MPGQYTVQNLAISAETLSREYDFGVSRGFLGSCAPVFCLGKDFEKWDLLMVDFDKKLGKNTFAAEVEALPLLNDALLVNWPELKRAFVILSMAANGYVWSSEPPRTILPKQLAVPLHSVSKRLGMQPITCFASVCLWNFFETVLDVDEIKCQYTFTGTVDENWFYAVSIAIEKIGSVAIPNILQAIEAVRAQKTEPFVASLVSLASNINDACNILNRMSDHCDPHVFYVKIRRYLAGWINNDYFPYGLLYEGVFEESKNKSEQGSWIRLVGGSNAQSPLIHALDIALEVKHTPVDCSFENVCPELEDYNTISRLYMPRNHRMLLRFLQTNQVIRSFTEFSSHDQQVTNAYNSCIKALSKLRAIHLKIVHNYIVVPSKNMENPEGMIGTGGSKILTFLKKYRDETKDLLL